MAKKMTKKKSKTSEKNKDSTVKKPNKSQIKLPKEAIYWTVGVIIILLVAITGYNYYKDIKYPAADFGDKVAVKYVGSLESGEVFDTNVQEVAEANNMSRPSYPDLEFTLGNGQMIKGFEDAVLGMRLGEKTTVKIPPKEAYGAYKSDLVYPLELGDFQSKFPSVENVTEGMQLPVSMADGSTRLAVVKTVGINVVVLDFNHRLAGKTLTFDIELVSIE